MKTNTFCKVTGLSRKTALWVFDNLHKKTTFQREFTDVEVNWVMCRKLSHFSGNLCNVPNFPFYYVSDRGVVYNYSRGFLEELKGYYNNGYHYVNLVYKGQKWKTKVSRLVALLFIPNPEGKPVVNHIDGDKGNDNVKNLEWVTISENTKHAFDTGLAVNAVGFEDSQAKPVMYITLTGTVLGIYGSICIAAKKLNMDKSHIARAAKANTVRFLNNESLKSHSDKTFIYYTKDTQLKLSSSTSISK